LQTGLRLHKPGYFIVRSLCFEPENSVLPWSPILTAWKSLSFVLGFSLLATGFACGQSALRSPWDERPVKLTDAPYACSQPIHLTPDLTTDGFYSDAKGSIIDPVKWKAYELSAGPVKKLGILATVAADAYLATGSRQAASCVLTLEKTAALDRALTGKMSSHQAYFVQGWVEGALAIALLKVRPSGLVSDADQKLLSDWMKAVSQQTMGYYDREVSANKEHVGNNHLYWAGVQVAAVAIAANDPKLMGWAAEAYRNGSRQITSEGTLPLEMRRGQRALHYHLYAIAPLVYIAEFAEVNGIHLYAENGFAIRRAVARSVAGLEGSGFFDQQTGIKQDLPDGKPPSAEAISWAKVYLHRFPEAALAAQLAQAPALDYMYLGGLPPY
jgi:poly(beta-D-mannuronate) lyase